MTRASQKEGWILSQTDVMHLRVQTASPLARMVLVIAGLGFFGGAFYLAKETSVSWWLLLVVLPGAILVAVGIRGRKKEVEQALNGLDSTITNSLLDGLF
jgi:hypothetical protein